MKLHHFFWAVTATAALWFAGCESDSSSSAVCTNDEVKADCQNGKYSKCIDGSWTETACEGNVSCTADGKCGECMNDSIKDCINDGNGKGQVTVCQNGKWSETKVACPGANPVSCTADGKCGECLDSDSIECTNNSAGVGVSRQCKSGKWDDSSYCPGLVSCSMSDDCYQCFHLCDTKKSCDSQCDTPDCQENCNLNAACRNECRQQYGEGCEMKCGECFDTDHIRCTEDEQGVGRADICFNGTWKQRDCKNVKNIQVSCTQKCLKADNDCEESEFESICGECLNQDDPICIDSEKDTYKASYENFPYHWQMVTCSEGKLWIGDTSKGYTPCTADCANTDGRKACLQTANTP